MSTYKLTGRNALNEKVKLSSEVTHFSDERDYFRIEKTPTNGLKVTTPKGVYYMKKHETLNIFVGVCAGRKVHVSLKKVVGELRHW